MFIQFFLFVFLLVLLFLITRGISNNIYSYFFLLTQNRKFPLGVVAFLFLPGTIIHEMSHFLIASILGVKTGELSVFPDFQEEKKGEGIKEVKAGKLDIYGADPFRQLLIGLAPILSGLAIIYIAGNLFFQHTDISYLLNPKYLAPNILGAYFLFVLSSTMFSSRKDLESAVIVLPVVGLAFYILHRMGVRILLDNNLISTMEKTVVILNKYLLISALTDYAILLLSQSAIFALGKILRRKIIRDKKN